MIEKVIWYGHATMGMETNNLKIVIDPYFTNNPAACTTANLVNPDYILVSHGHSDHLGDTLSMAKRSSAMVICNAEISGWLGKQGIKTHAQHIGGGYHHPFGYLKFTQALHGSGLPDGAYGGNPAGFLLTTKSQKKIYFACDTGLFGDMRLIGEEGLALAVLPIGDNFTMGPDDALRAVKMLEPAHVIPIHYNTWGVIAQDPQAWAKRVAAETKTVPHVIKPGESFEL